MEKKIKFSDKNAVSKIVYLTVIAILCVSAIVIGIVASNNRKRPSDTDTNPPVSDGTTPGGDNENDGSNDGGNENENENVKPTLTFVCPTSGTVYKSHSTTTPVFSNTLDEWRIHTGIDISTEDGASVFAVCDGEVTGVYNDPMLGQTIEITHSDTHKSYYSNLEKDTALHKVGDNVKQGDTIGYVGDTTISELADEPHLHFEMKVSGESVNPLDYFTEESKLASLGIVSGNEENDS
ncbi:MAG: M23 family metallopeptidase [Clostridia bacterium]|nr:M23 family metallopeptidase [Clostridia bacterium]